MTFTEGNGADGKHYWLTPEDLMAELRAEFDFDFDPCPYPRPDGFDGLTAEWGASSYVNPPFGSVIVDGRKKGPTAWARKAIAHAGRRGYRKHWMVTNERPTRNCERPVPTGEYRGIYGLW